MNPGQAEQQARKVLDDFLDLYGPPAGAEGPVLCVRDVWGANPDPWQERVLRAYGRGERRISIRSCHGPGKTAVAAWIINHQLLTRYPQKTVATAPTSAQLFDGLFSEVVFWHKKLPEPLQMLFEVKSDRVELRAAKEASFFSARTARAETPEALQGIHSDHVLLVVDEASGVPEQIFQAGQGSMSGETATTLLLSNPTRTTGYFSRTHNDLRDEWVTEHVSYKDSTRVSADFVRGLIRTWGEDSDEFRVRALGEFPKADLNTLIPAEFVDSARERDVVVPANALEVWGLDVARFGDDWNALVRRNKLAVMPTVEKWSGIDLMQTAGRVKAAYDACPSHQRPEEILVDEIGLGAGVVDRLMELKLPVRGINVSETAAMTDKYRNLRTELWFKAREWLGSKNHRLPKVECCGKPGKDRCVHDELADELKGPRYGYTSTGKMLVEPKADMKRRGLKSPNIADALMLTFASEPTTLLHGSGDSKGWARGWAEPLKRGLAHV